MVTVEESKSLNSLSLWSGWSEQGQAGKCCFSTATLSLTVQPETYTECILNMTTYDPCFYQSGQGLPSFFFFCLLRAALKAYGGSQARGQIGAAAYAIATTMPHPRHICNLHHSSWQCQILSSLSEARDRTRNLMVTPRFS